MSVAGKKVPPRRLRSQRYQPEARIALHSTRNTVRFVKKRPPGCLLIRFALDQTPRRMIMKALKLGILIGQGQSIDQMIRVFDGPEQHRKK